MPSTRLAVPARQPLWKPPQRQIALDWGHPSARALVSFFLFNEGGGRIAYDLAASRTATLDAAATWSMGLAGPSPRVNGGNTSTQRGTFSSSIVTTGSSWSVELMFLHSASQAAMGSCILSNGANYGITYESTGTKLSVDGTGSTAETTALTAGVWAHEVLTWDGTTSTFFRNGLPNGSGTGAGSTAPATFDSWLGASAALNQTPSSIAWMRVWSRIVGQAEALDLFATPFAMVQVPADDARTYSILSGRPLVAPSPSPVLSAAILAGASPAVVAPFPNLVVLASPPPAGNIVSGSVSFISNSLLAETAAQVVAPATMQANALLSEAAQVLAPATIQANSALVETPARVVAPATVQSISALVESAQVLAPATIQSNSLLAESVQIVEPSAPIQGNSLLAESAQLVEAAAANVQANSALALPTAQVVDPSLPFVSNSLLAVTGGLAGAGGGTIQANSALVETAAQIRAPATLASSSALAQSAAQLRANVATVQSNSALQVTGSVLGASTGPTSITVSDVALWATALTDAAVWATAVSDAPLAVTGLGDAATGNTNVGDVALAQTALTDA